MNSVHYIGISIRNTGVPRIYAMFVWEYTVFEEVLPKPFGISAILRRRGKHDNKPLLDTESDLRPKIGSEFHRYIDSTLVRHPIRISCMVYTL